MFDGIDLSQAPSWLNALCNIAGRITDARSSDGTPMSNEIAEYHRALREALNAEEAHRAEKEELRRMLREYESWEATEARYNFNKIKGVPIYNLDEELVKTGNYPDLVCAKCFQERKISPLHESGNPSHPEISGTQFIYCPTCKERSFVGERRRSESRSPGDKHSWMSS